MKMKKEHTQEIIIEISETVHMKKREIKLLKCILDGQEVLPCLSLSFTEICRLSFMLNEVGLSNYYNMGSGQYDASWKLLTDAVSNYRIKKRPDTINAIIA
jgi:hypothetical protein